jgi:DMSO/TMAO reductase YedYZ molybdopterin-dependent catalytic subunit
MTKKILAKIIAIILILTGVFLFFSNILLRSKFLKSIEIAEYQGEKLSSINDFRENSIKGSQKIDTSNYNLRITGLVSNPMSYSYQDIIKYHQNYEKVVKLNCVEGWSVKILWKGILAKDLIIEAKPQYHVNTVIFKAQDGYSTSFPIDYVMNNEILIAYKINNLVLPQERGFPFQLVAESKWGYKWIKWITEIELSSDTTYRGYWESRGYSNQGDLNQRFFERQ